MAADRAAVPFRNKDAETAVESGNPNKTKRGEKMSPPPSPTMVSMKEEMKITGNKKANDMAVQKLRRSNKLL